MLIFLVRFLASRRRKREALREIRRNGWRSPYLGDGRRSLHW